MKIWLKNVLEANLGELRQKSNISSS